MLREYVAKQKFNPDILGLFINPFFFARRGLFRCIKQYAKSCHGNILDVGCGAKPYQSLFVCEKYIGIDIDNPGHDHSKENIDFFYDGKKIPFEDNSYDGVLTSQVLEHVIAPQEFLPEIYRVLKPGGLLLLTVPFVWDEHEKPNDYTRFTSFGLRHLLETNGFEILDYTRNVNNAGAIFQLINLYIYKKLETKNRVLNALICCLLIAPFTVVGCILSVILPTNNDLFLDNVVLAKKK